MISHRIITAFALAVSLAGVRSPITANATEPRSSTAREDRTHFVLEESMAFTPLRLVYRWERLGPAL